MRAAIAVFIHIRALVDTVVARLIKPTTDEKGSAAKKEREACAAHVEEVFRDGSMPVPLTQAYRTVTEAIRNGGRR